MKSKNYEHLYEMICNNEEVLAFVDYKFPGDNYTFRDPCKVYKLGGSKICISARGKEYGGVGLCYDAKENTELEIFITECKKLNLEWCA